MVLAARQGAGIAIGFGGTVLLVRLVGPDAYGLYAAAFGLAFWAQGVLGLGVALSLVRRPEDDPRAWAQGFTLTCVTGLGGAALAVLASAGIERGIGLDGFRDVGAAVFAALPLWVVAQVGFARMERDLAFGRLAVVELVSQLIFFAVALPAAFAGAGAWAPVLGLWCGQVVALALAMGLSGLRPRFVWDRALSRELVASGSAFTASVQLWQLRHLVNPLVVGGLAGADAVAHVSLAHKLVESLGFVKNSTWRLALAAMARLRGERLRAALEEGLRLQVLAIGPLLVGFAWVAPVAVPALFGPEWAPTARLFPLLALAALTNAVFTLHASALYALGRTREVAVYHLAHVLVFGLGAAALVPRYGVVGYGWAELAACSAYVLAHVSLAREVGAPDYRRVVVPWAACALALFPWQLGWWTAAAVALLLVWPDTWRTVGTLVRATWRPA